MALLIGGNQPDVPDRTGTGPAGCLECRESALVQDAGTKGRLLPLGGGARRVAGALSSSLFMGAWGGAAPGWILVSSTADGSCDQVHEFVV